MKTALAVLAVATCILTLCLKAQAQAQLRLNGAVVLKGILDPLHANAIQAADNELERQEEQIHTLRHAERSIVCDTPAANSAFGHPDGCRLQGILKRY
jgi:hypothetical protein